MGIISAGPSVDIVKHHVVKTRFLTTLAVRRNRPPKSFLTDDTWLWVRTHLEKDRMREEEADVTVLLYIQFPLACSICNQECSANIGSVCCIGPTAVLLFLWLR